MHDEVSETENIRKNLAIERMIIEGCDILLDVNQVFVRQGTLLQLPNEKPKGQRNLIGSFKVDKEAPRQCFLFTNHMILTTRTSAGRLHLVPTVGKIPLADATLIEDPSEPNPLEDDGDSSVCSLSSQSSSVSESSSTATSSGSSHTKSDYQNLDFKLVVDVKNGPPLVVHLVATTIQEKAAWISDISHCMDNVHFNDLFHGSVSDTSSVTMPHSIRNDPRLFKDDVDIRFSRTLNSCKVPQIRYATPERLLERLTDLRFLSIDFLNTFLLTYRVFTDGVTVLEALKHVHYNPEIPDNYSSTVSLDTYPGGSEGIRGEISLSPPEYEGVCRIRTSSIPSSDVVEWERERAYSHDSRMGSLPPQHWRWSHRKFEEEQQREASQKSLRQVIAPPPLSLAECETPAPVAPPTPAPKKVSDTGGTNSLNVPQTIVTSTSSETLTDTTISAPSTPTNLSTSTNTLVGSGQDEQEADEKSTPPVPPQPKEVAAKPETRKSRSVAKELLKQMSSVDSTSASELEEETPLTPPADKLPKSPPPVSNSQASYYVGRRPGAKRGSADTSTESSVVSPRSSFQHSESPQHSSKAGVVITSHRASQRRSSTSSAAAAFAVATAGSSNPRDIAPLTPRSVHRFHNAGAGDLKALGKERPISYKRESMICTAATMRVLNVLRHWVSKHSQDFESDSRLKELTVEFLEELACNSNLLPVEHKAATQLLRMISREDTSSTKVDLDLLLAPPMTPSKENIETLSALEIAEQITYLDHKIFVSIRSEEFLSQAWMKPDKTTKAPNILLITRRFNDVSRLVVSEIILQSNLFSRITVIEKWAAVADICRCLHNFNGVLQICAAFTNSAVFRLKKTWEKVPKTTRQSVEKLQTLVSSDGRFRNLRDALHRCDPPCIPYLGMYLTDLSFIEEGTPNFTEEGLLNFSKMRMVAHVIREIRHFQQTPYKIEMIPKVSNYLLDPSFLLPDEELYRISLDIEPRQSRLSSVSHS